MGFRPNDLSDKRSAKPKPIVEDDLHNPIKTYQTDFNFIKEDIDRFREQNMNHECFQVLHPWAYELDSVDFKYIVNNNLTAEIVTKLANTDAVVFWLSFFLFGANPNARIPTFNSFENMEPAPIASK